MAARATGDGTGTAISRSSRPGRRSAGSSALGRLVAATTARRPAGAPPAAAAPSSSVSSCAATRASCARCASRRGACAGAPSCGLDASATARRARGARRCAAPALGHRAAALTQARLHVVCAVRVAPRRLRWGTGPSRDLDTSAAARHARGARRCAPPAGRHTAELRPLHRHGVHICSNAAWTGLKLCPSRRRTAEVPRQHTCCVCRSLFSTKAT